MSLLGTLIDFGTLGIVDGQAAVGGLQRSLGLESEETALARLVNRSQRDLAVTKNRAEKEQIAAQQATNQNRGLLNALLDTQTEAAKYEQGPLVFAPDSEEISAINTAQDVRNQYESATKSNPYLAQALEQVRLDKLKEEAEREDLRNRRLVNDGNEIKLSEARGAIDQQSKLNAYGVADGTVDDQFVASSQSRQDPVGDAWKGGFDAMLADTPDVAAIQQRESDKLGAHPLEFRRNVMEMKSLDPEMFGDIDPNDFRPESIQKFNDRVQNFGRRIGGGISPREQAESQALSAQAAEQARLDLEYGKIGAKGEQDRLTQAAKAQLDRKGKEPIAPYAGSDSPLVTRWSEPGVPKGQTQQVLSKELGIIQSAEPILIDLDRIEAAYVALRSNNISKVAQIFPAFAGINNPAALQEQLDAQTATLQRRITNEVVQKNDEDRAKAMRGKPFIGGSDGLKTLKALMQAELRSGSPLILNDSRSRGILAKENSRTMKFLGLGSTKGPRPPMPKPVNAISTKAPEPTREERLEARSDALGKPNTPEYFEAADAQRSDNYYESEANRAIAGRRREYQKRLAAAIAMGNQPLAKRIRAEMEKL